MSFILKSAIRTLGLRARLRLERAASSPALVQRRFLFETLKENARTSFGRLHGFDSIRSEADYRKQVPVRDYEEFRPFVNQIMNGAQRVLTDSEPFMLTMTSGTTGEPKFIPVTHKARRLAADLMNCWFSRALREHPEFLDQKGIGIVGQAVEGRTAAGLPYGSMSGLTYKNLPCLLRRIQAIPYEVFEAPDYDERYFLMARFALCAPVSFIATPNPSTLLRLAEVCDEHKEGLIRAIHDGTPGVSLSGQPEILSHLAAQLKPDRARAAELKRIVERTGALRLADCWTSLKLLGCWVGGSVRLQAQNLAASYGAVPVRDLGYMASEGHFTVPLEDNSPSGVLALNSNYYEFIPEAENESAHSQVLSAHELQEGERYSILLTTASGLYRYRIGDIVEVTGRHARAPLIAFRRKEGEMASITGEKLHINHLFIAIEDARRRFNLSVEQFRAVPDFARRRYEIFLELNNDAHTQMLSDEVLPLIDGSLAQSNLEYAQKRRSKRLQPPCLHLMARGWSRDARRRHVQSGRRDAQYKWRILCHEAEREDLQAVVQTIEMAEETRQEKAAPFCSASHDAERAAHRVMVA